MNIDGKLKVKIETWLPDESKIQFDSDIWKLQEYLPSNAKWIIIQLFLQLGKVYDGIILGKREKVFDYKNLTDIKLAIQPKIKNYITFTEKYACDEYIKNEINKDELYLVYKIENGRIITE